MMVMMMTMMMQSAVHSE